MDKLEQWRELFRMQTALNERLGAVTEGGDDWEKIRSLLHCARAMTQEITSGYGAQDPSDSNLI